MRTGWGQRFRFCVRIGIAFGLQWISTRARGENHLEYRYEYYGEEGGRMTVGTHSGYFEQQLIDNVTAHGEFVYDAISGATPTGAPPVGPSNKVPLTKMTDTRYAGNAGFDIKLGANTLSPEVAYSTESDYESIGISLSDAIELNQKNTTLRLGASHNFDSVDPVTFSKAKDRETTDLLLGVSQLLSPKTILSADFTYRMENGFLSDPYRLAEFDMFGFAYPEHRPRTRESEIFQVSLTQFITPLDASIEGSYRFQHDTYDITSHTFTLWWHQHAGKHLIIEPLFRYYQQTAASFYAASFPGIGPDTGQHFSADYRLSEFYSLDMGVQATVNVNDHVRFVAGYHRYEMHGLDNKTASSMYPTANIVTAGIQIWF